MYFAQRSEKDFPDISVMVFCVLVCYKFVAKPHTLAYGMKATFHLTYTQIKYTIYVY